jgi:hypothetical protein
MPKIYKEIQGVLVNKRDDIILEIKAEIVKFIRDKVNATFEEYQINSGVSKVIYYTAMHCKTLLKREKKENKIVIIDDDHINSLPDNSSSNRHLDLYIEDLALTKEKLDELQMFREMNWNIENLSKYYKVKKHAIYKRIRKMESYLRNRFQKE